MNPEQASKPKPYNLWRSLGPGLVTGAADDDPSGIATYSQAGAQIGLPILWLMIFTWPLMSAIQLISGRIGRVTGRGLSANIRRYYGAKLAHPMMVLLFLANVFNLGADISAMGAAAKLMFGGNAHLFALVLTVFSLLMQTFIPYHRYAKILKWVTFVLFAYVGVVFFVRAPLLDVLKGTFLPTVQLDKNYIGMFIAVLGTTISPYLFFWQSSQEVEEIRTHGTEHALRDHPEEAPSALKLMRNDTVFGMGISNLIAYCIIYATAATLHNHGVTNIATAEQAAQALRPIAGEFCFLLFALGLIGTGLLGVPTLAGSAAFAVGEALRYPASLEAKLSHAKVFYAVLALATLLGLAIIYSGLNPIKALVLSAVINGVVSVPIMIVIMLIASRKKIMGPFTVARGWKILGWLATAMMTFAAIVFFATL